MKRPMMQFRQTRHTFSRKDPHKWVVHVDGARRPGMEIAEIMARIQDLLSDPSRLRTIIIEVDEE